MRSLTNLPTVSTAQVYLLLHCRFARTENFQNPVLDSKRIFTFKRMSKAKLRNPTELIQLQMRGFNTVIDDSFKQNDGVKQMKTSICIFECRSEDEHVPQTPTLNSSPKFTDWFVSFSAWHLGPGLNLAWGNFGVPNVQYQHPRTS